MPRPRVKHAKGLGLRRFDPLSVAERSARMAKVRSRSNRSTEAFVASSLAARGIGGWRRNVKDLPGRPDFVFVAARVALFVDGCFWHGCPVCDRRIPRSRRAFWQEKITTNRLRDRRVTRQLRAQGYRVLRVWEHSLKTDLWFAGVLRSIQAGGADARFAAARSATAKGSATT
jgi:DNA mismatch endonuclease, patch repair protein